MTHTDQNILIGRFGKPFGLKGWIKILSFTEPKENILLYQPWLIPLPTLENRVFIETGKLHGNSVIAKIPNYENPEQVRIFTNKSIYIARNQLPSLNAGEYYWSDLEGLKVINKENVHLGNVAYVTATGANDVLVVKQGRKERWIPLITNVILAVELSKGCIQVDWDENF